MSESPLLEGFESALKPPFMGSVADWGRDNVRLPFSSRSTSFDPDMSPFLIKPLNALADVRIRRLILLAPPGGGKTTWFEVAIPFIIAEQPGPTMIATQTDDTADEWGDSRLMPVLKACEPVSKLFPTDRYLMKKREIYFSHMLFMLNGANMTNFQEKSLKYALGDEVWRWDSGLIKEYEARLHDRWDGKLVMLSQAGYAGEDLDTAWLETDMGIYGYTCRKCKKWYRYVNADFRYEVFRYSDGRLNEPKILDSVYHTCPGCHNKTYDRPDQRREMSSSGDYHPTNPNLNLKKGEVYQYTGFQYPIWAVWWVSWGKVLIEWIKANDEKKRNNFEPLRQFVMKRLVEAADAEVVDKLDSAVLFDRRENYDPEECLPEGTLLLTAGVDCQDDRLEVEIDGWGLGKESWAVDYHVINGSPTSPRTWEDLEDYLQKTWPGMNGTRFSLSAVGIDTGHHPNDVYAFVKPRQSRKYYAFKGSSVANMPIVSRPKKSGVEKARLFMVGTDTAKTWIYSMLKLTEKGPGFMHYPIRDCFDPTYFSMLTSEKVVVKVRDGERIKSFQKHGRNEPLDCRVYSRAAFTILNPNLEKIKQELGIKASVKIDNPEQNEGNSVKDAPTTRQRKRLRRRSRSGGFGSFKGGW